MPRLKWHKAGMLLTALVFCCLLFAGTALAASYNIYGGENPATGELTNYVKASHTYDYLVTAELDCPIGVGVFAGKEIVVEFPGGFDLTPAVGRTVPVEVTVTDGVYYMQVVPTIDGQKAIFLIQRANLPETGEVTGFKLKGIRVVNHHVRGEYCVKLSHECIGTVHCIQLNVVETVGLVKITSPAAGEEVTGGTKVHVEGEVWATCNEPWPYDTWPVIIDIVDAKGFRGIEPVPCTDPCDGDEICPVIAHTEVKNGVTTFQADIIVPACGEYGYEYTIRARTVEVKDENQDDTIEFFNFTVDPDRVPAESLEDVANEPNHVVRSTFQGECTQETKEHAWLKADPVTIVSIPGVAVNIVQTEPGNDAEVIYNKPNPVTVCVEDQFHRQTTVPKDLKIDLAAYIQETSEIAGVFKDAAGNEISHVYIPAGEGCVTVDFFPNAAAIGEQITIEERAMIGDVLKVAKCEDVSVIRTEKVTLEVTPLVTDEDNQARAGWPLKAAVWFDTPASEEYEVRVELRQGPKLCDFADWATWDTELIVDYDVEGRYPGSGDIYDEEGNLICDVCHPWATYIHPYCTTKSHFYIYVDPEEYGKYLYVTVTLTGKTTGHVLTHKVRIRLVSPVELVRFLRAETWQIISTPKKLVGKGDMCTLLNDNFTDALTYRDGQWYYITDEPLEPLYAYYVKTKQGGSPDEDWYAAGYVFARVTQPGQDVPPTRILGEGWNLVGTSLERGQWDYQWNLYQQRVELYKMLGTTCDQCKKVYNPGGMPTIDTPPRRPAYDVNKLGNLAPFVAADLTETDWYDDRWYHVYNGDGYWVYMTEEATLAAQAGQELVDP